MPDGAIVPWLAAHYDPDTRYRYGEFDLDGDGTNEAFVYIVGRDTCGSGGCGMAVLKSTAGGFVEVAKTTVTRLPIGVGEIRHDGWRDIVVTIGGGGEPAGLRTLRFDGKAYPSNPTIAPAVPASGIGAVVIAEGDFYPIVF